MPTTTNIAKRANFTRLNTGAQLVRWRLKIARGATPLREPAMDPSCTKRLFTNHLMTSLLPNSGPVRYAMTDTSLAFIVKAAMSQRKFLQ